MRISVGLMGLLSVFLAGCPRAEIDYPQGWNRPLLDLPDGAYSAEFLYADSMQVFVYFEARGKPEKLIDQVAQRLLADGWTEERAAPGEFGRKFSTSWSDGVSFVTITSHGDNKYTLNDRWEETQPTIVDLSQEP